MVAHTCNQHLGGWNRRIAKRSSPARLEVDPISKMGKLKPQRVLVSDRQRFHCLGPPWADVSCYLSSFFLPDGESLAGWLASKAPFTPRPQPYLWKLLFYVYECSPHMPVCTAHVTGAREAEEGTVWPGMVVTAVVIVVHWHICAGRQTWVLCGKKKCSKPRSCPSSSPVLVCLVETGRRVLQGALSSLRRPLLMSQRGLHVLEEDV